MSDSDPSSVRSQKPDVDTRMLIAQLTMLMPQLLHLHQRSQGQQAPPQYPVAGFVFQDPMLDHLAAVNFVEDITAASLRTLASYLEANSGRNAGLQSSIGIVTRAAHCFAARDFGQAFSLIWQAYHMITVLRAADPLLPPLHSADGAKGSVSASNTSIH